MASLIIKSDNSDNLKLMTKLAKKLGVHVNSVTAEQSEDFAIGDIMNIAKTVKSVGRDYIIEKLHKWR